MLIFKSFIKKVYKFIYRALYKIRSKFYIFYNIISNKKNNKIKVCYYLHLPELLDKSESVLDLLEQDDRFELYILVIPLFNYELNKYEYKYNLDFIYKRYKNIIIAYENDSYVDIKTYNFDYVFFQRPYDDYLPNIYRSRNVVKFSKCCYISYAYFILNGFYSGYNYQFFDNMFAAFMESENAVNDIKNKYSVCNVLFSGYPVLTDIKEDYKISNNVLWTPRWTMTNHESHFFDYKDSLLDLTSKHDKKLMIRPHPLAFDNYIRNKLISKNELSKYLNNLSKYNAKLDVNNNINDTFKDTYILISDISSIIIEYFLTGKPIIYCKCVTKVPDDLVEMFDLLYVAENFDDIKKHFLNIIKGNDYLYEKRIKYAKEFNKCNVNAAKNIVNHLLK